MTKEGNKLNNAYRQSVSSDNPIIMFVGKGGVGKTTWRTDPSDINRSNPITTTHF